MNDDGVLLELMVRGQIPPLTVPVRPQPLALGRRDPSSGQEPEIDLTSFGAHQDGVSRRHAELQLYGDRVCIEDLGSRNGTFVNGERLAPYVEHPLYDGDWIRLGKLLILVSFVD